MRTPPSSKMLHTAHFLLRTRVPYGGVADAENSNSIEAAHEYINGFSHGECGEFIRQMYNQPNREIRPRSQRPKTGVGIYNVGGAIYRVRDVGGGHLVVEALIDGLFYREPGRLSILKPEDRMSLAEAMIFGLKNGRCVACGHLLKSVESKALGISPECEYAKEYWT